jgi:hypothetical protein
MIMNKQPRHSGAPAPQHIDKARATQTHPPKLGEQVSMDMFHSRPLRSKEKTALLDLLQPGHDDETRCAAAQVILRLGIEEAIPIMNELRAAAPPIVRSAFQLATRFMKGMKSRSCTPLPEEHLGVLMVMRNSNESLDRHYADIVLQQADIKYGTPLQPDLDHPGDHGMFETSPQELLGDLDYAFRKDAEKAYRLPDSIRKKMGLGPKK